MPVPTRTHKTRSRPGREISGRSEGDVGVGGVEKNALEPRGGRAWRCPCAPAAASGPPSRARAPRNGRGAVAATSVATEVRRPEVPQIPRPALRCWDDVVERRAERVPWAEPELDRAASPTAQPAHRTGRAHDAEESRVLGSAELLGIVWHLSPPGRPGQRRRVRSRSTRDTARSGWSARCGGSACCETIASTGGNIRG